MVSTRHAHETGGAEWIHYARVRCSSKALQVKAANARRSAREASGSPGNVVWPVTVDCSAAFTADLVSRFGHHGHKGRCHGKRLVTPGPLCDK